MIFGWVGFYLVKGAVRRDYETGIGQIMATTPLSRPLYTLGKWASNFAVLGLMVLLLLLMGVVMQLAVGVEGFNFWKLSLPALLVAMPSFVGFTPQSPLYLYVLLSIAMIVIAMIARQRQVKNC